MTPIKHNWLHDKHTRAADFQMLGSMAHRLNFSLNLRLFFAPFKWIPCGLTSWFQLITVEENKRQSGFG